MKCARCNRLLDKPALLIGGQAIGPKCAKIMGLADSAKPGRPGRQVVCGAGSIERCPNTLELFGEPEMTQEQNLKDEKYTEATNAVLPITNANPYYWPTGIEAQVCADIAKRQQMGIAKYGTTVADNPLTHRQWLEHAYQEALDMAVYLRRAMAEIDAIEKINQQNIENA